MSWGPGTLILNRYRLESLLGRGGMGSVWRAEHVQLKSPVAVKLLDPSIATNEQVLARFLREAQAAASLRSPHVVQIFDYGVEEGTAFIAMEMLQGQSLNDRVAARGKLAPDDAFRFLQQVLRAMGKAHEAGIVHRDLKPDNIFICHDEPEFAKVLDFGVAKVKSGELSTAEGSRTQTGMMIGTPYYMSPEQTQAKDIDQRADLWAIGVIAFECLTGVRPFTGDSFGELVIAINTKPTPIPSKHGVVPAGFDEWFVKATQRDRDRRFQSAREMADELAKVGGAAGTAARSSALRTNQTPAVVERPLAVGALTAASASPAKDLRLTTGARSVTSHTVGSSGGRSPVVLSLAAVAALIVVGVGAFVAFGGPKALMHGNEAAVEPVIAPASVAASLPHDAPRAPELATPAVAPPPSAAASVGAAQPVPSVAPSLAKKDVEPAAEKVRSGASVKKTGPATPNNGTGAANPAPPKDWNF